MNTPINNGGPAFPHEGTKDSYIIGKGPVKIPHTFPGMSLRDYFAGQALAGLVAHNDYGCISDQDVANGAYDYADAMLEQREVKP